MINLRQASAMLVAIAVVAAAGPTPAAPPDPVVSEATIVPLFPQKERDLKKGVPLGMTVASFWAGHGSAKLTKLPDGKILTEFDSAVDSVYFRAAESRLTCIAFMAGCCRFTSCPLMD